MLELSDFDLDPRVRHIFEQESWLSGLALVENLELYKFLPRSEILAKFASKGVEVLDIPLLQKRSYFPEKEPNFLEVEQEFDVLIETFDRESVRVISSIFNNYDVARLHLKLKVSHIRIAHVTPINYRELKEVPLPEYVEKVLLRRIVIDAISKKATDIHMSVAHNSEMQPEPYTRYRIGADQRDHNLFKFDIDLNMRFIQVIVSTMTSRSSYDLDSDEGVESSIWDVFGDGLVSLRVSAYKLIVGLRAVFRIIKKSSSSLLVGGLGLDADIQRDLLFVSRKRNGATFITGAPRMGKSTTAYAILNETVNSGVEVQEFGSPIETLAPWTQVDYEGDLNHLKNLISQNKKQDTNIVLVSETPNSAIGEAVGDLVASNVHVVTTFHMNRLWHLPHKLYGFYKSDFKNILSQVNICVNQKMYEIQCPHCRTESRPISVFKPNDPIAKMFAEQGYSFFRQSVGCDKCDFTGGTGDPMVFVERLVFTEEIVSELLSLDTPPQMERFLKNRMNELRQSLEYYMVPAVANGIIPLSSLEDLL